ncbi:hypothetical protein SO802_033998 [Lithocarpus litseifolius]|uniref:Reverse transcriptase domain-containing protein n=1 Tax=Lithocarpus litseifolius TaxID=425828 RepID=A0AAW2BG03_9ROSI
METKSDKKNWMDMVKDKCKMKEVDGGAEVGWWHFTGFYGNPDTAKRPESWAKLKYLKGTSTLPWLTIGDFNEITGASEKEGGSDRPRQQMTNFIETINACGLHDLGYNGPKFTWNYERADGVRIRERLDRALATPEWLSLFPLAKLYHLSSTVSDYAPLVLRMTQKPRSTIQKKPFRFESMWLKDQRCEQVVTDAWEKGLASAEGNVLQNCLEQCRSSLDAWNKKAFGHVGKKVAELQRKVEWLELQPSSTETNQALRSTRSELNNWLDKEDAMWRQRSRLNWFQAGDRNTRFFHAKASSRQKKNLITGLLDEEGGWQEEEGKVEEIVVGYFQSLFQTNNPTEFMELLAAIQKKVTAVMNQQLTKKYSEQEVKAALKQMYPLKAPVKEPRRVSDYKPISLCNVTYKIASKAIANRLKKILPSIISETQSAFVHRRLITDNILVAFETMHHISNKKTGNVGEMALKLDMSKAYNRVEWGCLEKIMEKLGFAERWREQIMRCVRSVTYSIKINGSPRGHIIPSRGIRQGDPLSPYLFLLCAEGLSALIKASVASGNMKEVSMCRGGPILSHLFFADDNLIFCKASLEECNALQKVLRVYEEASGQQLNREKTSLFFSSNTPTTIKEEIKGRFGAQVIKQHEKYLGLPSLVGRNKRNSFNDIKEKVGKKLAGWKEKLLSRAGKEVLIKAMVQDTLVGELIDHEKVRWKAEVLAALFLPYEVDIIQSIPLSSRLPEDKLVWAETSNGKFSVRSAYTVATRLSSNPNSGTSSDMGPGRQFWKRLWALPLPHKTRHFAWRALPRHTSHQGEPSKAQGSARQPL